MAEDIKFFVGLDVHKDTIAVAVAEAGRAPARLVGSIAHDMGKLLKVLARYGAPRQLQVVYEAGPRDMACSGDAVNARTQGRHQLKAFLLRHGVVYTGKTSWCKTYYRWLGMRARPRMSVRRSPP